MSCLILMLPKPIWESGRTTKDADLGSVKDQTVSSTRGSGLTTENTDTESRPSRMDPGRRGNTRITS